jgi:hypothetical protein
MHTQAAIVIALSTCDIPGHSLADAEISSLQHLPSAPGPATDAESQADTALR